MKVAKAVVLPLTKILIFKDKRNNIMPQLKKLEKKLSRRSNINKWIAKRNIVMMVEY